MKLAVALLGLSVAVMVVMVFLAVRQELDLRETKSRMVENSAEVRRKEESILHLKNKIKEMKAALVSVNAKIQELKTKKTEGETSVQQLSKSLQTCNMEKAADEKKKTDVGQATIKFKMNHQAAKQMAQNDIQNLKQQILDRDKALCAFADTTKEEARRLCGMAKSLK